MTTRDMLLGGSGLDGYAFNADTYCIACGQEIIVSLNLIAIPEYLHSDTDHVPQPIFFGESDQQQYCCECGEYLYGSAE